jgi:hypothetical protein
MRVGAIAKGKFRIKAGIEDLFDHHYNEKDDDTSLSI